MTGPDVGTAVLAWAATYLLHSTALFALAWSICRLGGRLAASLAAPVVHTTLWRTALVGALATSLLPTFTPLAPVTGELAIGLAAGLQRHSPSAVPEAAGGARLAEFTVWAWGLTTLLLLARLTIQRARLVRLLWDRRRVPEGAMRRCLDALCADADLRRYVRLSASSRIATPMALGRSEICVPERSRAELTPEQQRAMLAHELAHLIRADTTWLWATKLIETIFWFQPLNRLAARRMQDSAELVADAWAVERTGGHRHLAACLTTVAAWLQDMPSPQLAVTLGDRSSSLMKRVRTLLQKEDRPSASPTMRNALVALVLAAAVLLVPTVSAGAAAGQQDQHRQDGQEVERVRALAEARSAVQRALGDAATTDYDDEIRVAIDQRVERVVNRHVHRHVHEHISDGGHASRFETRHLRETIRHVTRTVPRELFRDLGRTIRTITRVFRDSD